MEVYRFDEEAARRSEAGDGHYSVSPLTDDAARIRVDVLHLPAGGAMASDLSPAKRLVGVVTGKGWASGAGGDLRQVHAGQALVWLPGERQDLRTDDGLMAISIVGEFDVWAMGVTRDIEVCEYDPIWPQWFAQLHDHVWPAVADVAVRIDHVGSTSVPGLAAKPIIDLDIVVAAERDIAMVIERLAGIGYRWRGDLGVMGREAFKLIVPDDGLPPHHLYLVVEDNKAHLDHWLLRDLLRADPMARAEYAELKRRNAVLANRDMDVYVAAKAAFVADLLTRARAERGLPQVEYWQPDGKLPSSTPP